jgi:hypothetical protein
LFLKPQTWWIVVYRGGQTQSSNGNGGMTEDSRRVENKSWEFFNDICGSPVREYSIELDTWNWKTGKKYNNRTEVQIW